MRIVIAIFVLFISFGVAMAGEGSPLGKFSAEWNKDKYKACNTAAKVKYMTAKEKEVIYVLNLARMYPALFCSTVVRKYPQSIKVSYYGVYQQSLIDTMEQMKPSHLLQPDSACYVSAECHARVSGASGYVGHDRIPECRKLFGFYAECCDYGNNTALDIVMSFLIDNNVESLGHRTICLGGYRKIGVSIQPHKKYGTNSVLDFY